MKDEQAIAILIIISIITVSGFISNPNSIGILDWESFLHPLHAQTEESIKEYGQIPLWNPYKCGGNYLLAHPESPLLSPFFIIQIIFGQIIGTKIAITLFLMMGMIGMYFLARNLKITKTGAILSAIIFMLPTYSLRIITSNYSSIAYIPWIFLAFQKSRNKKYLGLTVLLLTISFFSGATTYIFIYSIMIIIAYATIKDVMDNKFNYLKRAFIIIIIVILLSSTKLIPVIEANMHQPEENRMMIGASPETIAEGLLIKKEDIFSRESNQYSWWEYGYYLGILTILIFIGTSTWLFWKKKAGREYTIAAIIFLILTLKIGTKNIAKIIFNLPILNMMQIPSRMLIIAIFFMAITCGIGISRLEKTNIKRKEKRIRKRNYWKIAAIIIIVIIATDLIVYNKSIFERGNGREINFEKQKREFMQIEYVGEHIGENMLNSYLQNKGTIICYESFLVPSIEKRNLKDLGSIYFNKGNPTGRESIKYKGEAYMLREGNTEIKEWSPNKIRIITETTQNNTLILNQNYDKNWRIFTETRKLRVGENQGLISTNISPQETEVIFYYLPTSHIIGTSLSIITAIILVIWMRKKENNKFKKKYSKNNNNSIDSAPVNNGFRKRIQRNTF